MYTVPVIPPDLRHEETIIQAANALDCLQSTITNIFDRIDKRISKNNAKIIDLSSRINSASVKIQNLCGTNKSIKIFSPAKFPSSHVFRDIELTFRAGDTEANILQDYEIDSRVDPVPNNIQEKLVFFHFRSAKDKSTAARVSSQRGLGEIPANIRSVNSVLLFSSAENVYGARRVADDINRGQRVRGKSVRKTMDNDANRGLHIEPAPKSLSNRQKGTEKRLQQGLFYTPRLNEAPVIDLPVDLPDLPGIADDIQFDHTDNHQIAPSLFIENLTDLPEIAEVVEIKTAVPTVQEARSTTIAAPAPPPPPPPPMAPVIVHTSTSVVPPPPPPPPAMVASTSTIKKPTQTLAVSTPSAVPITTDVRSNLMDAIRKAGGAKGGRLRAAADVARQSSTDKLNSVPNQTKSTSGGDLMADLHNKLLMRRKGISGAKDGEGPVSDSGNMIGRLSALIPPPPARTQNSSSDDDDAGNDTEWVD